MQCVRDAYCDLTHMWLAYARWAYLRSSVKKKNPLILEIACYKL